MPFVMVENKNEKVSVCKRVCVYSLKRQRVLSVREQSESEALYHLTDGKSKGQIKSRENEDVPVVSSPLGLLVLLSAHYGRAKINSSLSPVCGFFSSPGTPK